MLLKFCNFFSSNISDIFSYTTYSLSHSRHTKNELFVRNIRKKLQLCITLFTKYLNLQNLKHDEIINIDSLILKNLIYCINYNFFLNNHIILRRV